MNSEEVTKTIDMTGFLKEEHQGKWIAYSPSQEKVYAAETNLKKLVEISKKINCEDLVLHKVTPFDQILAP